MGQPAARPQNLPTLNDLLMSSQWPLTAASARTTSLLSNPLQDSYNLSKFNAISWNMSSAGCSPELRPAVYGFLNSHVHNMQRLQSTSMLDTACTGSPHLVHRSTDEQSIPSHTPRRASDQDMELEFPPSPSWARQAPANPPSSPSAAANKIFPRRKAGQAFRVHSKPVVLDESVLRNYFDLPLHEAAVQLGISATAMKSACRFPARPLSPPSPAFDSLLRFLPAPARRLLSDAPLFSRKCGITKWPYRTVTAKGSGGSAPISS